MIPSPPSLRATLDSIDEMLFYSLPITPAQREEFAIRIISCQVQSGPDAGKFSHASVDGDNAPRLFSGERLYTQLAARHTLLIDSTRLLTCLEVKNDALTRALALARLKMETRCYAGFCNVGECRHLTVAFMRYLIASQPPGSEPRLSSFFTQLTAQRDGQGRWGRFPFFYTLLMLSQADHPLAAQERQYTAPACKVALNHLWKDDTPSHRRKTILQRILERS